jgi:ATP-dependent DNA helicase RecQ
LRRPPSKPGAKRTERSSVDGSRVAVSAAEGNDAVFEALRAWRREVSREHGVPAYTVFHDSTLRELARALPRSLEELRSISGIGATKLERYGAALLQIIHPG